MVINIHVLLRLRRCKKKTHFSNYITVALISLTIHTSNYVIKLKFKINVLYFYSIAIKYQHPLIKTQNNNLCNYYKIYMYITII